MPDSKFINKKALFGYTEWNNEMIDLYNRYSLVSELNQDLMQECPVYAMYTLSEYLRKKRVEVEEEIKSEAARIYTLAGTDPVKFSLAVKEVEQMTYDRLKPYVQDYMTAKFYFVMAMHKTREEYDAYIRTREERYSHKTK